MLTLIPPAQAVQRVSLPAGQPVRWHPAFIPLSPALPGLCHGSVSCGGSFWLHQMLSCLMQLLRDSPMQPTKTV